MENNYYGPSFFNTTHGTNCTIRDNVWVPDGESWPDAAKAIMAGAGVVDACAED